MFYPLVISRDWHWIQPRIHCQVCADTKGIVSVNERGEYDAACVFDAWSPNSVQAHICIENPWVIRHGFLREIADYVFNDCGRGIIIGPVPGDNTEALKFDKHIGFTEVGRIKDGFDHGVDYVILEMRREDCRWLTEKEDGWREKRSA